MVSEGAATLLTAIAEAPAVIVTVIATQGSTPREVGARMIVAAGGVHGSIGGGQLEHQETAAAQALLARRTALGCWHREVHRIVLGPDAGQCCGGVVEVLHEMIGAAEVETLADWPEAGWFVRLTASGEPGQCRTLSGVREASPLALSDQGLAPGPIVQMTAAGERLVWEPVQARRLPVYLYGAGHVARALVHVLQPLPFAVTWIDVDRARFPAHATPGTETIVAGNPADVAGNAPARVIHLIMTHSHDLDHAICDVLLRRDDVRFIGLIGSATKRARFVQRFRRDGIADDAIERLTCPIGLASVPGKLPAAIAVSVVAQLLALPGAQPWSAR